MSQTVMQLVRLLHSVMLLHELPASTWLVWCYVSYMMCWPITHQIRLLFVKLTQPLHDTSALQNLSHRCSTHITRLICKTGQTARHSYKRNTTRYTVTTWQLQDSLGCYRIRQKRSRLVKLLHNTLLQDPSSCYTTHHKLLQDWSTCYRTHQPVTRLIRL